MQHHCCLARQCAQRATFVSRRVEEIIGNHFQNINTIKIRKYAYGKFAPPAQPNSVLIQIFSDVSDFHYDPQPPHPPPPQPLPPSEEPEDESDEPHDDPQDDPQD